MAELTSMERSNGGCLWGGKRKSTQRCAFTYPVEVGCRGFTWKPTQWFLKSLRFKDSKLRKALKDLSEEAELGNLLLWLQKRTGHGESKDPRAGCRGSRETSLALLHHTEMFNVGRYTTPNDLRKHHWWCVPAYPWVYLESVVWLIHLEPVAMRMH